MPATSSDQTAYAGSLGRLFWATIEIFTTLAIVLFLAVAVIAIPGFVFSIEKSERLALPKADRLVDRPTLDGCSHQASPDFDRFCLRGSGPQGAVKPQ